MHCFIMVLALAVLVGCGAPTPAPNSQIQPVQTLAENEASSPDGHAPESHPVREAAMELAKNGETLKAEDMMRAHAEEIAAKYGEHSREHAWTLYDVAVVLTISGQMEKATGWLRQACEIKTNGTEAVERDRLTFLMNLGEYLQYTGEFEEAAVVLQKGLDGREAFYGVDHAGYAFGLEPLAEVQLQLGKLEEALALTNQCLANFKANGHPRITTATALRAELLSKLKRADELYALPEDFPVELMPDLIDSVLRRVSLEDLEQERAMLLPLLDLIRKRVGSDSPLVMNVLIVLSNLEMEAGQPAKQAEYYGEIVTVADKLGELTSVVEALNGQAMALGKAGDAGSALACYADAKSRAAAADQPLLESVTARNLALFLAELERVEEAAREFEFALERAEAAEHPGIRLRTKIAFGIFKQHQGEKQPAALMLEAALQGLDPASTDAICGRSHLNAIKSGEDCGCNAETTQRAIGFAIREYVQKHTPTGLVEDVSQVDGEWTAKTSRQPTEEEAAQLLRAIEHAVAHFRLQAKQGMPSVYDQLRGQ